MSAITKVLLVAWGLCIGGIVVASVRWYAAWSVVHAFNDQRAIAPPETLDLMIDRAVVVWVWMGAMLLIGKVAIFIGRPRRGTR